MATPYYNPQDINKKRRKRPGASTVPSDSFLQQYESPGLLEMTFGAQQAAKSAPSPAPQPANRGLNLMFDPLNVVPVPFNMPTNTGLEYLKTKNPPIIDPYPGRRGADPSQMPLRQGAPTGNISPVPQPTTGIPLEIYKQRQAANQQAMMNTGADWTQQVASPGIGEQEAIARYEAKAAPVPQQPQTFQDFGSWMYNQPPQQAGLPPLNVDPYGVPMPPRGLPEMQTGESPEVLGFDPNLPTGASPLEDLFMQQNQMDAGRPFVPPTTQFTGDQGMLMPELSGDVGAPSISLLPPAPTDTPQPFLGGYDLDLYPSPEVSILPTDRERDIQSAVDQQIGGAGATYQPSLSEYKAQQIIEETKDATTGAIDQTIESIVSNSPGMTSNTANAIKEDIEKEGETTVENITKDDTGEKGTKSKAGPGTTNPVLQNFENLAKAAEQGFVFDDKNLETAYNETKKKLPKDGDPVYLNEFFASLAQPLSFNKETGTPKLPKFPVELLSQFTQEVEQTVTNPAYLAYDDPEEAKKLDIDPTVTIKTRQIDPGAEILLDFYNEYVGNALLMAREAQQQISDQAVAYAQSNPYGLTAEDQRYIEETRANPYGLNAEQYQSLQRQGLSADEFITLEMEKSRMAALPGLVSAAGQFFQPGTLAMLGGEEGAFDILSRLGGMGRQQLTPRQMAERQADIDKQLDTQLGFTSNQVMPPAGGFVIGQDTEPYLDQGVVGLSAQPQVQGLSLSPSVQAALPPDVLGALEQGKELTSGRLEQLQAENPTALEIYFGLKARQGKTPEQTVQRSLGVTPGQEGALSRLGATVVG